MKYKAKSLSGAQTRVRQLQKQVDERDRLLKEFDRDRKLLARLAAKTPQFFNPLEAMAAETVRDRILSTLP